MGILLVENPHASQRGRHLRCASTWASFGVGGTTSTVTNKLVMYRRQSRQRIRVTAVALTMFTGGLSAQPVTVISSTVTCGTCRIELVNRVTLGSPSDTISPTDFQTGVVRDSRGRYYIVPVDGLTSIAVYDSTGRFLRTIGRNGSGPGEYGYLINAEIIAGDSILALDAGNRRLTVLSPSYTVVRSLTLRGTFTRAFPLPAGQLLVNGNVNTQQAAGYPVHVLGPDGAVLRSFGDANPRVYRERDQFNIRWVERSNEGDLWLAHVDRYEIERWSIDGRLLRTYRRDASWFPPRDYSTRRAPEAPPPPMVRAVWQDVAGRVWTISRVPSAEWKAPARVGSSREQPVPPFEVEDRNSDAIVEVFDPSSGALLASRRFPHYLLGNVGLGAVYALRATDNGDLRVDVWQMRLTR